MKPSGLDKNGWPNGELTMYANARTAARDEIASLWKLVLWIDQRTHGLSVEAAERKRLAAGCFNVVFEHQAAIARLCKLRHYVSALALLRSVLEALVRGMWIHRCATENELDRFKKGKLRKTMAELVHEVEDAIGDQESRVLSGVLHSAWEGLNGFTHTGMNMVSRQFAQSRLEANVSESEICTAVGFAGALGLVAALELLQLSEGQNDALAAAFMEKMTEYASSAQG